MVCDPSSAEVTKVGSCDDWAAEKVQAAKGK